MYSNVYDVIDILNFVNSPKTQKSKYLQNETSFFLHIKKFIHNTLRASQLAFNSSKLTIETLELYVRDQKFLKFGIHFSKFYLFKNQVLYLQHFCNITILLSHIAKSCSFKIEII